MLIVITLEIAAFSWWLASVLYEKYETPKYIFWIIFIALMMVVAFYLLLTKFDSYGN